MLLILHLEQFSVPHFSDSLVTAIRLKSQDNVCVFPMLLH